MTHLRRDLNEAAVRQARIDLSWQRRALAAEAARVRDAEEIQRLREAHERVVGHMTIDRQRMRKAEQARARDAEALTTAISALKVIAAPEHRMPDDWAAVAQNALDAITRKES